MEPIQSGQSTRAPLPGDYLPPPMSVACDGDPGEVMAALAVETGEAERANAHQEREAEEAAEAQANAAAVQSMHDEASSMRAQGFFDAATSVAGAVVAVACPLAAAGSATVSQAATATTGQVAGHLVDGGGKLGDGFFHAAQRDDEANAAAHKASATQHEDVAKDAAERDADANATIAAALDFDRSYSGVEAQTQLAALHRA
jgi:hypothetical protein